MLRAIWPLAPILLLVSACSGGDIGIGPGTPPLQASFSPSSVAIDIGETTNLFIAVSGGALGTTAEWFCVSSSPGTASVVDTNSGCAVTGGTPGVTTVTAVVITGTQSAMASATVTVRTPPPLVATMTPGAAVITQGETADFTVGTTGGDPRVAASCTCASSNTGIASVEVTASGCRVTGVSPGGATITATATNGSETSSVGAELTVIEPPTLGR